MISTNLHPLNPWSPTKRPKKRFYKGGAIVETETTPGAPESSPAPDGSIVGPGDHEKDVKKK